MTKLTQKFLNDNMPINFTISRLKEVMTLHGIELPDGSLGVYLVGIGYHKTNNRMTKKIPVINNNFNHPITNADASSSLGYNGWKR